MVKALEAATRGVDDARAALGSPWRNARQRRARFRGGAGAACVALARIARIALSAWIGGGLSDPTARCQSPAWLLCRQSCALGTPVTVACTPLRAQLWLNLMPTSPKRIRPTTPSGVFLLMLRDGASLSGKGLPRMKGRTLSMPCIVFSTGGKFRRSSVPAEMVRSQRPGVLCTRACLTLGKNVSIRCNGICTCVSVTTCTRI